MTVARRKAVKRSDRFEMGKTRAQTRTLNSFRVCELEWPTLMSSCLLRKNRPAENASRTVNVLRLGKKRTENERETERKRERKREREREKRSRSTESSTRSSFYNFIPARWHEVRSDRADCCNEKSGFLYKRGSRVHASDDLCKAVAKLDRNGA